MSNNLEKFPNPAFIKIVDLGPMQRLLERHVSGLPHFHLDLLGRVTPPLAMRWRSSSPDMRTIARRASAPISTASPSSAARGLDIIEEFRPAQGGNAETAVEDRVSKDDLGNSEETRWVGDPSDLQGATP